MIKVKVLSKFRDKHTGVIYKANDVIEVTEKRFAEINAADNTLVAEIAEEITEVKTEEKPKGKRATKKQ